MKDICRLKEFEGHELVSYVSDEKSGLRGFIAIHNTALGPATGGTRYRFYKSDEEALRDALRLSRAMTYKCALAGVPYGGGKAVIMADGSGKPKSRALLSAYARRVNLFGGSFYTGEDVGVTQSDVVAMAAISPHVGGRVAGDLGAWAALGVFNAMQAAVQWRYGSPSLKGRVVAVKGLGKLGFSLCSLLAKAGASMVVADIDPRATRQATRAFPGIRVVNAEQIHREPAAVYAPCAFGGEFGAATIPDLRCDIICGGANNQLVSEADAVQIHRRGILYVPDYLANAGGLINVVDERNRDGYSARRVMRRVRGIGDTAKKIFVLAERKDLPTLVVADRLAESIFRARH